MMKKLMMMATVCTQAQSDKTPVDAYFTTSEMPDMLKWCPAPPDTIGPAFAYDIMRYMWGKQMRNCKERADIAVRDAVYGLDCIIREFSEPFGLQISKEETPEIYKVLREGTATCDSICTIPKRHYMRKRPFMRFNEPTLYPADEPGLRKNGSYPSGHTLLGWSAALLLSEINPDRADTILARGLMYGDSRLIVGAHWQSDVSAGYLCGAAAVARAHTNPALEADIRAAREEYARLKGLNVPDGYPVPADYAVGDGGMPRGERILNAPVDTASYRHIGEYMRYRQAFALRETERGEQAVAEGDKTMAHFAEIFGEAMGITVSESETPAIWQLILAARTASSRAATTLKTVTFRKRPYVQTGEPTTIPADEEKEFMSSSYPSAHTSMSWGIALTLAEMAPEHQDEILRRGYQFGYSRLITGYHWGTDIDDARLLASATVARQHADPQFRQLIAAARQEYEGLDTAVQAVALPRQHSTGTSAKGQTSAFRLDGIPATATTRGIVIENNKKTVK